MPYAYICTLCRHPSSGHTLAKDAASVEGPYSCGLCECQCTQQTPTTTMTEAQFSAAFPRLYRRYGAPQCAASPMIVPADEKSGDNGAATSAPTRVTVEVRDAASGRVLFRGAPAESWEYVDVVRSVNAPTKLFCEVSDLSASAVSVDRSGVTGGRKEKE